MSRSRPYCGVSVNKVNIESLALEHRGVSCVLGIDVAKLELVAVARWPDGTFERPWQVRNPSEVGILIEKLSALNQACPLTVAMESSGTYGDAFRQSLHDASLPLVRVSAKAVSDEGESFDGVPSHHDGKDAAIIADLAGRGKGRPWELVISGDGDQEIRYWVRKLDGLQRMKQVHAGRLEALLARHWPEVQRLLKGGSPTLLRVLARWGDPRALGADPQAAGVLSKFGGLRLTAVKIAAVIESAACTRGVRMNVWEALEVKDVAGQMLSQRRELTRCRRQLRVLALARPEIRVQEKALGLVTACVLWTYLGDPRNYGSAGAYRKAMGLNLVEQSSGRCKGTLRLSKRGQRLTRKWLYFAALRLMQNPAVKPWTDRKKARDNGKGMLAVVAVMRRLAVASWHVAVHGVAFDAARLFPGPRVKKTAGPTPMSAMTPRTGEKE